MNSKLLDFPAFLVNNQNLFSLDSLIALDQSLNIAKDDATAESALKEWLKANPDCRDAFLNSTRGGLEFIQPSSGKQTGVRNTFPELRESVKQAIKSKADHTEASPKPDTQNGL